MKPLRQIVLDTETTGLKHEEGHRIIEIGCIELIKRKPTRNNFHHYINPQRKIDAGALEVHGISQEFLADKPTFSDIAEDFLAYLDDSELIIHNAEFDIGFLNSELARLGANRYPKLHRKHKITDTLLLARKLHPKQRNNLDALCKRYQITHHDRSLHGALLDANILAEVYLAMTGGQMKLDLNVNSSKSTTSNKAITINTNTATKVIKATAEEISAHESYIKALNKDIKSPLPWPQ